MNELGDPDYSFHRNEVDLLVGRIWRSAEPWILLLNAWQSLVRRGHSEHRAETAITRWTPNHDKEKLARDREFEAWVRPRLERHPAFRALDRHLASLGLEPVRPMGFAEYSGQFGSYGFVVRKQHLPALERRAQDEAGLTSAAERARGAADFRTYLLRHYDENWEENRRTLPPIDESPYRIPGPD